MFKFKYKPIAALNKITLAHRKDKQGKMKPLMP